MTTVHQAALAYFLGEKRSAVYEIHVFIAAFQSVFNSGCVRGNWDLVFVARTRTKFKKSTQLEPVMLAMLKELKVAESEE